MDSSEESLPPQSQTTQTSSPASSKIPFGLPERTSRHWDRKVKERVLLELDAGNSVGVLSNRYGIPRRTIRNWKSRGINNSYGSGGGSNRTLNLSSTQSPNVSAPAAIKQQYLMSMANGNSNNSSNQLNTSGNCTLTKDQEKILYERIQRLSEFNQASIKEEKLQEIAYDFLDEHNIEHNFEYGKVDADWLDKFLYRNRHLGKLFTFISNEFYDLNNTNNDNNLEVINNALLTIKSGGKINIVAKKFNINEEILCARLKKESLIKPLLSNQQEIKLIQKLNTFKFPTSPSLIILTKSKIRGEIISFLSLLGVNYNHKSGYDWITEFVSQYYLQLYDQHNKNNSNNNNNINNGNHNHNNKNNNSKYNNNSNSDDEEFKNSLNNIKDATEDIKSGIPIRIVALKYNLPYQILRKWYAIETFLNKKHELYFVNSIKQMMLTKASIKNLLYEYCEKNFIPFQFTNQDDNTDHYDDDDDEFNYWYENFVETYSYLNIVTERQNASATNNNTTTRPLNNTNHVTQFKQGATFFNRSGNQSTPLRIVAVHQNVNTNCDERSRTQDDQDQEDDDNNDDDDDDENDNAKEDNNGDDNTEQNSSQASNVPSDDDGDERELQIDEDNNDSSDSEDDQNNDDTNNEEPPPNKKHHPDGSQSNDFSAGAATYDDASATDVINDLQTDADKDDDDMKFDYSLLNTDFYNDVTNYYENENDDLNAAKRKRWDNETKQRIMECITAGESVAAVSDRYKVPRRTIQNWKSILLETSEDFKKGILKLEEEFDLLSKLQVLKQNGAVITKRKFLEMVYAYCEEHNIKHPFRNGKAGRKWFINFQKRHPQFDIDSNDISLGDIPDDSFYQNDSIL